MAEQYRRRSDDRLEDKIDGLVGMLTHHAGEEEKDLRDIKEKLSSFFHELDAHTHIYHHQYVAKEIVEEEKAATRWEKIKTGLIEKAMMFILGSIATYLIGLIWLDFGDRLRKTEKTTTPAKYEIHWPSIAPPTQHVLYTPSKVAMNESNN